MKKIIILILMISVNVFAQEKLTLSDAVQIGLENNFQIKISKKNVEIADNNDSWGAAGRFPVMNFGIRQSYRYDNRSAIVVGITVPGYTQGRIESESNSATPYVNLSWTLFDGFKIGIRKDNFEQLKKLTSGNEVDIIETTIRDIIQAYYKSLLEKEKLFLINNVLSLSKDRYEQAIMKNNLGTIVMFDLLQFKNAFLRDSANYIAQYIQYKISLRYLNYLLGTNAETDYDPIDSFEAVTDTYELNDLIDKMNKSNKSLYTLNLNQNILKNNIDIAKFSWFPSLALNSGYNYIKEYQPKNTYSVNYFANLSLSMNLYNGGNTDRAIENAFIEHEIGRMQIDELRIILENNLKNQFELFNLRQDLFMVAQENKKSAELNLQIAADKLQSGAINSYNYRDIQLLFLNAATSELEAIYNILESKTELLKLTGGIIAEY